VREYARGAVAGAVGAVVTFALAAAGPVPPTGAVAGGALVAAALHWVTAERREFRTAGTTYALGAAALLALLATVPPVYRWSLVPSLAVFGLASALVTAVFVVVRVGARAVARRYVPEALAAALADLASTLASALAVVWTVLQVQERLARTGVTATLGTAALVADWYGLALPVEATLLGAAVDLPTVVFVGSVVVGFHTLASWEAAWRVAEESNARWRAGESSGAGDERGA
jgi:hypothetical protein